MTSQRVKMVAAAADLIARKGVAGTSIGDVLAAADAPRGSVYHHFPGGRAEVIGAAVERGASRVDDVIVQGARVSPADAVADMTSMWRRILTDSDFEVGSITAAAALARKAAPNVANIAAARYVRWEQLLSVSLRAHGFDTDQALSVAATVLAALEGAVILCRARQSVEPLDRVADQLQQMVRSPAGR
ncbi:MULTISPECIES: TetR/AcrR family transcriptional regulator [unclassified Gordonia (in: high G+C Gram-positive bacteria)]|uniref:TetR/AcrR family transcriptional regulator n=1 Tax=unclassified Gordonia (in: high G+C Gram-positive bacteria) TaxID=2657482 RepID=UPI001F0623BE|nr:TetR/AcrR family transcriptional regulator [Gordonia sp. PDNC005]